MTRLYMMIGLPGSGKSTTAKKIASHTEAIIHSSDNIREKLYESQEIEVSNQIVFNRLHKNILSDLANGHDVIYDATNLQQKYRLHFLKGLKLLKQKTEIIYVFMATSYDIIIKQNSQREHPVPKLVIDRMLRYIDIPVKGEGYSKIIVEWNFCPEAVNYKNLIEECRKFNQRNSHHSMNLWEHMLNTAVSMNMIGGAKTVVVAALLHDIGKLHTKEFVNSKGEETKEAHYYGHQYVGSYYSLFYLKKANYTDDEIFYIANLIRYHMDPYLSWKTSEKAKNKDKKILGGTLFNDVLLLHEADVSAH